MQLVGVIFYFDIPVGGTHVERGKNTPRCFFFYIYIYFVLLFYGYAGLVNPSTRGLWNEPSTYTTLVKQYTLPVSSYEVKM